MSKRHFIIGSGASQSYNDSDLYGIGVFNGHEKRALLTNGVIEAASFVTTNPIKNVAVESADLAGGATLGQAITAYNLLRSDFLQLLDRLETTGLLRPLT